MRLADQFGFLIFCHAVKNRLLSFLASGLFNGVTYVPSLAFFLFLGRTVFDPIARSHVSLLKKVKLPNLP